MVFPATLDDTGGCHLGVSEFRGGCGMKFKIGFLWVCHWVVWDWRMNCCHLRSGRGNTKPAENPEHLSHWGAEMMDVSLIYGDLSNRKWGRSWDIMWTRKVVFSPKKFHTPAFGHLAYGTQLNRGCQACLVVFGRSYNSKIVRWNH